VADEKPAKKKPGPKPKYAPGKRSTLTFRLQEPVRTKLVQECLITGRSLSEEIEHRLGQSFYEVDILAKILGGAHSAVFLQNIADSIRMVETFTRKKWNEDDYTRSQVVAAIIELIVIHFLGGDRPLLAHLDKIGTHVGGPGKAAADVVTAQLAPEDFRSVALFHPPLDIG
jgi:hypothetical protein